MLLDDLANLKMREIEDMIANTEGEERLFYVQLYNKVLEIRFKDLREPKKD